MSELHFTPSLKPFLRGRTLFITGASRGIGRAIAIRAAADGANVAIVAKTTVAHSKLPGTIYTVAEEVEKAGGHALPIACDIQNDQQIQEAIKKTVAHFGGIDILVNNASAIDLSPTVEVSMKKYDLMHNINVRGTFAVSKAAIPYLKKSKNAHILTLSPPLSMDPRWFASHVAYTMSKYGMSMVALGLAEELKESNIAVNALWPSSLISTAALQAIAGNQVDSLHAASRSPAIVADAAYCIFCQDCKFTGNFALDTDILRAQGMTDLSIYSGNSSPKVLMKDLFVDDKTVDYTMSQILASKSKL